MTGTPSVFTYPECNGTLWELQEGGLPHFCCRVGQAFSRGFDGEESQAAEHPAFQER